MIVLETLIINGIYLLFPFTVYLIYIAYIRNMDLEEKGIFFELAILSSVYLIMRYGIDFGELIPMVVLNVPLLICYLKKKRLTAVVLSILLILYYNQLMGISILLLSLEYIIYYIIYTYIINKRLSPPYIINYFILIKAFILALEFNLFINPDANPLYNSLYVLVILGTFAVISYIILFFLCKGEEVMDLNATIHELEKEKKVRASLFKITHEIKNPIAVCKGYLDMMNYKDPKKVEKYTSIIKDEINRTLILMDDFLAVNKVKIEKEEVDLYMLIEEICNALGPLFKKSHFKTDFDIPDDELYISLDYNRVKQVLVNIMKNSIEAKSKDRESTISLQIIKKKEEVTIRIKDNGIGMDTKTLKRVDEMFYTTKEKGTGLGVSLSKEIIELHDGKIKYRSALGKGTTVYITLPI